MTKKEFLHTFPVILSTCGEITCPDTWLPKLAQLCRILTCFSERHDIEVLKIFRITVKNNLATIVPFGTPSPYEASWLNACEKACNKIGL